MNKVSTCRIVVTVERIVTNLKTTPYLSMSYLGAAMCIISTAQHARPKVSGHSELFLPQLARSSSLASAHSTLFVLKSTWNGE